MILILMRGRGRFFSGSGTFGSLAFSETPATGLALEALFLLLLRNRRCVFKTEDLIHWFALCNVVVGKPTFTIEWAGISMSTPVRVFRWIGIYCARQTDYPSSLVLHGNLFCG